jgi:hypothetical protein
VTAFRSFAAIIRPLLIDSYWPDFAGQAAGKNNPIRTARRPD